MKIDNVKQSSNLLNDSKEPKEPLEETTIRTAVDNQLLTTYTERGGKWRLKKNCYRV